ncbi:hypothetical protein D0962_05640 [Leptolyngbyaceae cyanobacterium CCMR0082]|uniref:Uncharacterized protein n=1 Tax=Adonisia turfae CCMR0082 TaxID=2304604 RepID=A0A6M0S2X7_9CYAN|nr:hypothetical protein [Adonisia turfae]NEZ62262.1 hypothetical protein [Adonisia turfae CCMR0082]
MNLRKLATNLGLRAISEATKTPTVEDIDARTAIAINQWAQSSPLNVLSDDLPFPFIHTGKKILGKNWEVPSSSWGVVFPFQRHFWLHYAQDQVKSRWINGREAPQDVLE